MELPVASLSVTPILSLFLLAVGLPVAIAAIATALQNDMTWPTGSGGIVLIIAVVSTIIFFIVTAVSFADRYARFSTNSLTVRSGAFSVKSVMPNLAQDSLFVVSKDQSLVKERQLTYRTAGVALPGYKAGWFAMSSGESVFLWQPEQPFHLWIKIRPREWVLLGIASVDGAKEVIARYAR